MTDEFIGTTCATLAPLYNRTLPSGGGSAEDEGGDINVFNLMFIVGFAVLITVLARVLARRGRK